MSKTIIGIDPGLDGAIAVFEDNFLTHVCPMPILKSTGKKIIRSLDMREIKDKLDMLREHQEILVVIEKVHSMPKQGVASTFKFGLGYGQIQGICVGLGIPFILVTPQQWKKVVLNGYGWKGDKTASIRYVQQKYINLDLKKTEKCRTPHDGKADAVCIAEYALLRGAKEEE